MRVVWSQFTAPHQHKYDTGELGADIQRFMRPTRFEYQPGKLTGPIASMQPGDFIELVEADVGTGSVYRHDGNGSLKILDWNPANVYDPATRQVITPGCRRKTKVVAFSDITGRWREITQPSSDYNGTAHWYGGTAFNGDTAMLHGFFYNPSVSEWVPHDFEFARTGSLSWWPEYGNQGGWFNANDGDFVVWDVSTQTRVSLGDSGHGKHATAVRHPISGKILVLGGTYTNNYATLVDVDGSFSRVADNLHGYRMSKNPLFFHPDSEVFYTLTDDRQSMAAYEVATNTWSVEPYPGAVGGYNKYDTLAYDEQSKVFYVHRTTGIYALKL